MYYMSVRKLYNELVRLGGSKFAIEMHKQFEGEMVSVATRSSRWYRTIESLTNSSVADEFFNKHSKRIAIYVGKLEGLFRDKRNNKIREEYNNGADYRALARKYNLTSVSIRKIIGYKPIVGRRTMFKKEVQNPQKDSSIQ